LNHNHHFSTSDSHHVPETSRLLELQIASTQLGMIAQLRRQFATQRSIEIAAWGINNRLGLIEDNLKSIAFAISNPLQVQSVELRNRGIEALGRGWLPEAKADLTKAIEIDPYDYVAQSFLGATCAELGLVEEACSRYRNVVKYATPLNGPTSQNVTEWQFYADGVIKLSALLRSVGDWEGSRAILFEGILQFGRISDLDMDNVGILTETALFGGMDDNFSQVSFDLDLALALHDRGDCCRFS